MGVKQDAAREKVLLTASFVEMGLEFILCNGLGREKHIPFSRGLARSCQARCIFVRTGRIDRLGSEERMNR